MTKRKELYAADSIKEIRQKLEKWGKEVYNTKKERQEPFRTFSGLPIKSLYTPDDISGIDYLQDMGFPGEEPFVRGVQKAPG